MARLQGFIGPSYLSASVNANCQRSVNLYPEMDLTGTLKEKEIATLVSTPGLRRLFNTPNNTPVRGLYLSSNNRLFFVSGNTLYEVKQDYSVFTCGTLEPDTGSDRVNFSDNGIQLTFVDGKHGYIYALAESGMEMGSFSRIELLHTFMVNWTTSDLINGYTGTGPSTPAVYNAVRVITSEFYEPSSSVSFLDGYFVHAKTGSNKFFISGLYDGSVFDGTMFAYVESTPAKVVGSIAMNKKIWFFSEQGTDIYYDSGNELFPIEPVPGAYMEHGCSQPNSIAKINGIMLWLGQDKRGSAVLWASSGGEPVRKTTPPIERTIQQLVASGSKASAYTYSQNGSDFYVLNMTGSYSTYVYDIKNDLWHERASKAIYRDNNWIADPDVDGLSRHRVDMLVHYNGLYIGTDYATSAVYDMTMNFYQDDGAPIPRIRVSPHFSESLKNLFWRRIQLDMETGIGTPLYDVDAANTLSLLHEFMTNWTTQDLTNGYLGVGVVEHKIFPVPVQTETATLQLSDNGGHTFSDGITVEVGKKPNYRTRVMWRRLGKARDRVIKVKIEGNIPVTLLGIEAFIEGGSK